MGRNPLRLRGLLAAGLLAMALSILLAGPALADGTSVVFPTPVSPNGHRIFDLYVIISYVAIPIFIAVEVGLLLIVLRFRRKGPDHYGATWHHNTPLEIAWTIAPALVIAVIGVLSFIELDRDFNPDHFAQTANVAASDQMNICVQGYQFYWSYTYTAAPGCDSAQLQDKSNLVVKDTLVVPVGKFVHLTMHSDNVIHSWWVPAISGKTDAVPGYENQTYMQIEKEGSWQGECAELCGVGHGTMQIVVKALPPDKYDAWVSEQKASAASKPSPAPSPSK